MLEVKFRYFLNTGKGLRNKFYMDKITLIKNIIYSFANNLDTKNWEKLTQVLAENIICDYQDLRGTEEIIRREDFVKLRKDALEHLYTQHLFSNLEIHLDTISATCQFSALILRKNDHDTNFNTHAIYVINLKYIENNWLITSIKQKVLWNEGDPKIHRGVNK